MDQRQVEATPSPETHAIGMLRSGVLVATLSLGGRALGFVRTVVSAAWLGAGGTSDAFFVAFRIFGLLRAGLAAGGVRAALVPLFVHRLLDSKDGSTQACGLAQDAFASALTAVAIGALIVAVAMPWLLSIVAPGFAADPARAEQAVFLARIMLPCLILGGPALVLCAVLNGAGRFAAAASMAVLFNLSALLGLFALGPLLGPAPGLAIGVASAGAVQLMVLLPACRRAGFGIRLVAPRFGPDVRRMFVRAAPAAVAAGSVQATILVDLGLATLLAPGVASHLDYAARVGGLAPGLIGGAAATVLLPVVARSYRRTGAPEANRTFEVVLLLGIPGAVGLAVVAGPLVAAIFQHGAFTSVDTASTTQAIVTYAPGLPAWALVGPLAAVLFARGETAAPMAAALTGVAANLLASAFLMESFGHIGIASATALSAWVQVAVLLVALLRRKAFAPDLRLGLRLLSTLLTATLTGLALYLVGGMLGEASDVSGRLFVLAVLLSVGLAAFVLAAIVTGALRPAELAAAWRRS